ncbi:MAG: ABC transporter ATP-binding protein/permease [Treponema sp.]|nr:ABC transporter ATP-binding protein/permease [Treponema sp.]
MSTLHKLLHGIEKKYKVSMAFSPLAMIGEVVMEIIIPLIMANIVDVGIANQDLAYTTKVGLLMVIAACISLSFGVLGSRLGAVSSQGMSRNLRRRLFNKVLDFSFGNVDHFSSSSLVTRLTTDVTNVQNACMLILRGFIRAPFMLISGTIMACFINARLALIFFVAIPFLAIVLSLINAKAFPLFKVMLKKYDGLNNVVQENLTAIRVVKSFVRGKHEIEKFEKAADGVRESQLRAEKRIIITIPVLQMTVYACTIAVLWFGGNMTITGKMKTGELISFLTYIAQVLMSLMMLGMMFVQLVLTRASVSRICEVLDEDIDIKNPAPVDVVKEDGTNAKGYFDKVTNGSIEFRHVSFSYEKNAENCVLEDINLKIESGQMVGILGGTGSSKSTLVQLIPRLYDVLSGQVIVGGIDVRKYNLVPLRDSVAMVLQKNVLFSGTIADNLRWGNENASDEELVKACIASDAQEFVSTLPDGYNTELGQGGVNLSGGQKQRLCIARALLKNPKILIMDDSTSAVDTATDSRIRAALRNSLPDTTKIIIAQRISSVQDADVIFVLDDGKISGFGTHEELLKNNAIYREVYESQNNK